MKMACLGVFNFRSTLQAEGELSAVIRLRLGSRPAQTTTLKKTLRKPRSLPAGLALGVSLVQLYTTRLCTKGPLQAELEHSQYQYMCCLSLSLSWLLFCEALHKLGWNPISISCLSLPQGPCSLLHQIFPNTASTRSWGGVGKACSSELIFSSLMIMIWLMPLRNSWECFHIASLFPAVF